MDRKILLIEDDHKLRDAIQLSFEEEDYTFLEAPSVQEGIAALDEHPDIRVIILDLDFPGDTGIKFLEHIQDNSSQYRIIILTAHDELLAAEKASKYNVFSYQTKLIKLGVQSLKFAIQQAFQDIEGEFLKKKMTAHLQIQRAINSNSNLTDILNLICRDLIDLTEAYTCHIRVLDLKKGDLELRGCQGPFHNMNKIFDSRKSSGDYYSGKVAETKTFVIVDDLQHDEPFIASKTETLQKKRIRNDLKTYFSKVQSAYVIPIFTGISDNEVDAILNINSDVMHYFSDAEKRNLVDEFANHISLAVTKHWLKENKSEIHKGYKDISGMLSEVSSELKGEYDLDSIYDIVYQRISSCINPEVVSVFLYNEKTDLLENIVEYRQNAHPVRVRETYHRGESLTGWVFKHGEPLKILNPKEDSRFKHDYQRDLPCVKQEHYLCAPMKIGIETIGVIRLINKKSEYYDFKNNNNERHLLKRGFSEEDQAFLEIAASHLAVAIRNAQTHQDAAQWIDKLTRLNEIMQRMSEVRTVDKLLELILHGARQLIDFKYGLITRVDPVKGKQHFVTFIGGSPGYHSLPLWEGITGKALLDMEPKRVDDVQSELWRGIYKERWADTRSELAVPIFISSAEVRIGREVDFKPKLIGAINLENPVAGSFSKSDEDILVLLARHAAIMIERLEYEHKTASLSQMERDIAGKQDWDEIIRIVMKAITDTLGYEYVNISLVDRERNRIKTEYIIGVPEDEAIQFKKMADHPLNSDDIQAHIVRNRQIEVPDRNDQRFDTDIVRRFRHQDLCRVFIPMVATTDNQVIGTVEAGYQRKYRPHIYEQDIQILEDFIDYAVDALEQRKKGLLDKISHEFRAPIVGIRSNASFLIRRFAELESSMIQRKFSDIMTDSELLLFQVKELEYILGRTPPVSKQERTFLFRDIIIKTIRQLKPLAAEANLNSSKIEYDPVDITKTGWFYIDRAKLNQVVYNVIVNSIKYAEEDPDQFTIRISLDRKSSHFIFIFKDWGIGIKKKYKDRIFDDGFRAPEAIHKNVTGSGLGLTISRKIMREMGGDLILANHFKPTEFQIILPTILKERQA